MSEETHILGIPSLDLNYFRSTDPVLKAMFVKQLGKAFEEYGFVAIKNHGIPQNLIDQMYREAKSFFDLSEEEKKKYIVHGVGGQRGYTPFGAESAKGEDNKDLKEFWQIGQTLSNPLMISPYGPNIWPTNNSEFKETGLTLYRELEKCANLVLSAVARYLYLDDDYFKSRIKDGESIIRIIHYPPLKEDPKGSVRAASHEDINFITILVGAQGKGLEILTRKGEWLPVTAVKDHIIVNAADMLQRLTNRKFISTTHRVVNPPETEWNKARFSMPFFVHPRSDIDLTCLQSCIDDNNPKLFSDMTAYEYLTERLQELGLISIEQ